MRRLILLAGLLAVGCSTVATTPQSAPAPTVYVVVWFDTEDYLLKADDDAILRNTTFMTSEGLKGTFKVVGEKARVLEQRGRTDVIDALKKHEIGYHSNFHSVHPTPAQYMSGLGWDEGMAEFERRERRGWDDLVRIFGQTPSCYGQPGSSWGPQAFGVMRKWGMKAYLDTGSHVSLDGKPHYYCGLLTMYRLTHTLRTGLGGEKDLQVAKEKFDKSRAQLLKEGGGLVSIFYHPCEFVHKQFWDSIFKNGANPPREEWTPPPQKTPEESKVAYETFESWIRYIKSFPEVKFITASQAAHLYHDKARDRGVSFAELRDLAAAVGDEVNYQQRGDIAYTAGELFTTMNGYVEHVSTLSPDRRPPQALFHSYMLPYGPDHAGPPLEKPITVSWSQFRRTVADVHGYLGVHNRIPSTVWMGSTGIPPESYYTALARVTIDLLDGKTPETIEIRPAKFTVGARVADDSPKIWGWLFPEGWHAPEMMALARRQAWTIKPAILDASR
jgi:hypothetical protein